MNEQEQELKHLVEAVLLAAGRPVAREQLLDLFETHERPSPEELQAALDQLAADYESRGIELQHVAGGWRIQVRSRCMDMVSRLWQERPAKYSRALLETLALIAYRQPITRGEIEAIRGVSISSTIMRTLQERNWIRVVGHREVPGRPEVLGTTRDFLDYFGLKKLEDLPSLAALNEFETVGVQLELPGGIEPLNATAEAAAPNSAGDNFNAENPPEQDLTIPGEVGSESVESTAIAVSAADAAPTEAAPEDADSAADGAENSASNPSTARNAAAAEEDEEAAMLAAPDEGYVHDIEEPPFGA